MKLLDDDKTTNPKLEQMIKTYQQTIASGISPSIVAEKLFQALLEERFYIPTDAHLFVRSNVKRRMEGIIKDFIK